jgi:hypothetical protein
VHFSQVEPCIPLGRAGASSCRSQPIKVAQSYLAALAADWDGSLDRLSGFLADPLR